ncbi:MAG: hypothetical protein LE169_03885 [Endomicrobium sp.]|nr:hypothetical protein [Endomicrobium sp.]
MNIYVKTDTPSAGKEQESPAALGTVVTTFLSWYSSIIAWCANAAKARTDNALATIQEQGLRGNV